MYRRCTACGACGRDGELERSLTLLRFVALVERSPELFASDPGGELVLA